MEDQSPALPAERVAEEFKAQLKMIESALQFGTMKVRRYFRADNKNKPPDKSLAPNILRYQAKQALREAGQVVEDEEEKPFDLQRLSNNGLCLKIGDRTIRIRKAVDGDIPAPGLSKSLNLFYQQMSLASLMGKEAKDLSDPKNYLFVWDVDSSFYLSSLMLACPNMGEESKGQPECLWKLKVPLTRGPAEVAGAEREAEQAGHSEELDEYGLRDLAATGEGE
jgi:hypothetical protein